MTKTDTTPIVYLAGKVGGRKWEIVSERKDFHFVASDASEHGFEPYRTRSSEHGWGCAMHSFSECNGMYKDAMQSNTLAELARSKFLLAYLDTPDSYGSIVEIATMSAAKKRSYLIIKAKLDEPLGDSKYRYSGDDEDPKMIDAYWFVGSLPYVHVTIVRNFEEAKRIAYGILDKYAGVKTAGASKMWQKEPATASQLKYLQALGYTGQPVTSKGEAGKLICLLKTGKSLDTIPPS